MASATIDWTPVDEAMGENTAAGYQLAVLEAGKILEQRLAAERVPGATLTERLENARFHLTDAEAVLSAAAYVEKVRFGDSPALKKPGTEKLIHIVRQAVTDIGEYGQEHDKPLVRAKTYVGILKGKQSWLVNGLLGVAGFFVLVLFLANSSPGQALTSGIVSIVNGFFSWIVTLLIIIAVIILVVLGTAIFLDRKSRGSVTVEDDHHH